MELGRKLKEHLANKEVLIGSVLIMALISFQFFRREWFYALLFVLVFLVQIVFRKRSFLFVTISVFTVILFQTSILNTFLVFKEQSLAAIAQPKKTLKVLFSPHSGEEILPSEVQSMLYLLRGYEISDYRLAPSFKQDPLIYQRIVEAAWPSRYEKTSQYILGHKDGVLDNLNCYLLAQEGEIHLVHCP